MQWDYHMLGLMGLVRRCPPLIIWSSKTSGRGGGGTREAVQNGTIKLRCGLWLQDPVTPQNTVAVAPWGPHNPVAAWVLLGDGVQWLHWAAVRYYMIMGSSGFMAPCMGSGKFLGSDSVGSMWSSGSMHHAWNPVVPWGPVDPWGLVASWPGFQWLKVNGIKWVHIGPYAQMSYLQNKEKVKS